MRSFSENTFSNTPPPAATAGKKHACLHINCPDNQSYIDALDLTVFIHDISPWFLHHCTLIPWIMIIIPGFRWEFSPVLCLLFCWVNPGANMNTCMRKKLVGSDSDGGGNSGLLTLFLAASRTLLLQQGLAVEGGQRCGGVLLDPWVSLRQRVHGARRPVGKPCATQASV